MQFFNRIVFLASIAVSLGLIVSPYGLGAYDFIKADSPEMSMLLKATPAVVGSIVSLTGVFGLLATTTLLAPRMRKAN